MNAIVAGALQECVVQSTPNSIELLPALFSKIGKGSLTGFQTRAHVEIVSLDWDEGRGTLLVKLKAKRATVIDVMLPKTAKPPKKLDAERFDPENGMIVGLKLQANKPVPFDK